MAVEPAVGQRGGLVGAGVVDAEDTFADLDECQRNRHVGPGDPGDHTGGEVRDRTELYHCAAPFTPPWVSWRMRTDSGPRNIQPTRFGVLVTRSPVSELNSAGTAVRSCSR